MANTASSEKRNRQSIKRNARNTAVRSAVKTAVKKAREAIVAGDPAKMKDAISHATRMLDKAATKGVLHARNAQRRISRLAGAKPAPKAAAAAK